MKPTDGPWSAVLVAGLLALCDCGGESPAPLPAPPAKLHEERGLTTLELTPEAEARLGIQTTEVTRRELASTRRFPGEVIAPPGATMTITAPWIGVLTSARKNGIPGVGSQLEKGEAIARLMSLDRDLSGETEGARRAAEARFELARSRLTRAEQLLQDKAGSVRAVEEARAEYAQAEAQVNVVHARLEGLTSAPMESAGGLTLQAPRAAVLMQQHVQAGQTVAAGTALFELASLDPLWIRVPIFTGELASVRRDRSAMVMDLGSPAHDPLGRHEARPVGGPPTANAVAATADLYFELPNPGGLFRPGQRVTVQLETSGAEETLTVPWSAVLYDIHGGTWVYENPAPRQFVRRRVEVPYVVGDLAVLALGPAVGTMVVSVGAAELFGTEFGPGK